MTAITPHELAERVRAAGFRLGPGQAAELLARRVSAGNPAEPAPGRLQVTTHGHRLADGLLAADPGGKGDLKTEGAQSPPGPVGNCLRRQCQCRPCRSSPALVDHREA